MKNQASEATKSRALKNRASAAPKHGPKKSQNTKSANAEPHKDAEAKKIWLEREKLERLRKEVNNVRDRAKKVSHFDAMNAKLEKELVEMDNKLSRVQARKEEQEMQIAQLEVKLARLKEDAAHKESSSLDHSDAPPIPQENSKVLVSPCLSGTSSRTMKFGSKLGNVLAAAADKVVSVSKRALFAGPGLSEPLPMAQEPSEQKAVTMQPSGQVGKDGIERFQENKAKTMKNRQVPGKSNTATLEVPGADKKPPPRMSTMMVGFGGIGSDLNQKGALMRGLSKAANVVSGAFQRGK